MTSNRNCRIHGIQPTLLVLVFLTCSLCVFAQQNQYDRGTPPQHAAGVSPLGSYDSADLGTVNLSNGALNLRLPIGSVGGRGFWLPLTLNYSSKIWSGSQDTETDRDGTTKTVTYADFGKLDDYAGFYERLRPGWTVGIAPTLFNRIVRINYTNINPQGPCYHYTLPKLTMMLPDKGEIEFRDDAYDGAPLPSDCSGYVAASSRGRRWHATDGSGTIYISDIDNAAAQWFGNLSGVVITSDGTRYRFSGGGCESITDRNGNKIAIQSANGITITDQLGRITTIQQNVADPQNPGVTLALLVTLPGYNGQSRYYKVKTGTMNQHYRSDINPTLPVITGDYDPLSYGYGWGSATRLFNHSYGLYAQEIDNWEVPTELILPDNRSLHFNYNQYGEVAEIQMPTGGKVWYDYDALGTFPAGNSPVWETTGDLHTQVFIDRALRKRRNFPDGSTLECTWDYFYQGTSTRVTATSASGSLMFDQRHYFLAADRYYYPPISTGIPDGTQNTLWSTGIEYRTETRDAVGAIIAAAEQDWTQRAPLAWSAYPQEQLANDNRVNEERKILDDGKVARSTTLYDQFNNPTESSEFDFDNTLKRRSVTSYSSTNLVNGWNYADDSIRLIRLPLQQSVYDGAGVEQARTIYEYDVYTGDGYHDYLLSYASITGHDTANYGLNRITRGNPTRIDNWIKTSNSYLYTYPRYDLAGNVVSTRDPRGNVTTISFIDDFGNGSNPGGGVSGSFGATYALPTLITSPPPQQGAPVQTARSQYDFSTGLLTGFRDRNSVVTQTFYDDPFNRPTLVKAALGVSGVENHAAMYYAPATVFGITLTNDDVLTAKDQTTLDDGVLRAWTKTDGFGRTVEGWSKDPQGDVKVVTNYDALGRTKQISNPYRPSQGETPIYTTTVYDLAGRVTSVTTPDSAMVTSSYSSNAVTVTDQNSKSRKSISDGLGRLIQIYEDPGGLNYLTSYSYDALDNLTGTSQINPVTQYNQTRSFFYDSLKRLTSAMNPESGTISYQYDNNGNLLTKTDARGVASTYTYDALNRSVTRTYSDGTPAVTYSYDPNIANGKGRLSSVSSSVSTYNYSSYDALGRVLGGSQTINGQSGSQTYSMSYTYDLAGHVLTQTYPSGRIVTNAYDSAGRTNSLAGNLGDGTTRTYSTGIVYSSLGRMTKEQFGTTTPIYNKLFYNSRGQLSEIRESTSYTGPTDTTWDRGAIINHYSNSCWGMCGGSNSTTSMTDNNGNLKKQDVYIPGSDMFTQFYGYDSLIRLQSVRETKNGGANNWQQQYVYDRYGNRTIDQANTWGTGIPKPNFGVDTTTNRLTAPAGSTMSYDAAGNLTFDNSDGFGGTRTYDAENRMKQAWANNQWQTYTYDGDGRRVKRLVNGTETWQVYGLGGELLAEYAANNPASSPQKEYGYRNGQLLITADAASGGNSLSLNGSTGYVQAPNSTSINITGSITLEAWIKPNSIGVYQDIVTRESWGQSGTGGGYELSMTNLGNVRLDLYQSPNTYTTALGSTAMSTGAWHHVAAVFDGSQMRVYLDGVLDGTVSSSSAPASGTSSLKIGRTSLGSYFNGLIDEVRVSNAAVYTSNFTPQTHLTASGSTKGLWKFDGQTPNDSSGNSNNGTLNGGATYSTDLPPEQATSYYSGSFDGSSAYVQVPNSTSINITGAITLEAWIKPNTSGSNQDIVTRESWGQSGTGGGYELSLYQGKIRLDFYQSPTTYTTALGSTVVSAAWHHVAAVFDGSQMRVYLDGVLNGSTTSSSAPASGTSSLKIGRASTGSYFNGLIDEVRVSNAAVYTSNFTPQTHLTASGSTKGLWKFDGQTLNDSSGNGNNGTLQGGFTYSSDVPSGDGGGGSGGGGSSSPQLHWLVTDQLGTPRMIFDQTGSLANVSRHDYLPFGEEISAGVGGRTAPQGYTLSDTVRQKFTQKERDNETGLDYFGARYYASTQGRFTGVDPIFISRRRLLDPQAINLYAYVRNNPLAYFDPNGEEFKGTDGKRVDIEDVDGQLVIRSKNATKDLIRLVNLINQSGSSTALGQFNKLNASKTMLNLVIDTTTVGGDRLGLHQPHGTRPDGSQGALNFNSKTNQFEGQADIVKDANGNEVYAEATITLYEGEFKKYYGANTQAIEDDLVSTFGHEAQHDLDPKQIQATKTHTGTDDIYHPRNRDGSPAPGSPYWMTYKILNEIRDDRALRAVKCIHGTCGGPP